MERRFANGLATLLGYSFSKMLDNVGDMTDVAGAQHGDAELRLLLLRPVAGRSEPEPSAALEHRI